MIRRDFMMLIGTAAAAWPFVARAESPDKLRRIGVLNSVAQNDPDAEGWDAAFRKRLEELGWIDGRNILIDARWGSIDRLHALAKELVSLNPDVLVGISTPATAALQAETHVVPIVFTIVSDPVGSGFVASLAKPGGNITGFIDIEASLSGKWLQLMREIAPSVSRVAFLFNPQSASFARYYLDPFRSAAAALKIEPIEATVHNLAEVESVIAKLGHESGAGLIVMPDASAPLYRSTILSLTERYRLPTIYPFPSWVTAGGLMCYGIDFDDLLRGAATYVDRILRGVRPSDLPVQLPTKFELIINLKTAKALGLNIPAQLLATADEVVE